MRGAIVDVEMGLAGVEGDAVGSAILKEEFEFPVFQKVDTRKR